MTLVERRLAATRNANQLASIAKNVLTRQRSFVDRAAAAAFEGDARVEQRARW